MQQLIRQHISSRQQNSQMHIRHCHFTYSSVAMLICLLASGIATTNAVPTDVVGGIAGISRIVGARVTRDVLANLMQEELPKEVTSAETTADQPQGQCLLHGVLVMQTSVSCEKQVGCRAIQKTGHCCPDYKCDCEKDGKTYLNGDKLVDPETPCTVCYCQGGEILCSSVTCFHRDDCKPKYIPGRCCPIYDNCPVSIFDPNHNVDKSTAAVTAPAAPKPEIPPQLLHPKITIKEITRPIEIRITDDNKAIPIHQMLKPSSTTEAPISTTPAPTTSPALLPTAAAATTAGEVNSGGESSAAANIAPTVSTDNNRQTLFPVGGINTENSLKLSASVAYPNAERTPAPTPQHYSSTEPDSSAEESAELFVKNNSQNSDEQRSALPLFSTQGLQRVDADASSESAKVNIKRENIATTERARGTSAAAVEDFSSSELIYAQPQPQPNAAQVESNVALQSSPADLEPETAGSDNIYHIILTTTGPRVDGTIDSYSTPKSLSSTEGVNPVSSADYQAEETKKQTLVLLPLPTPSSSASSSLSPSPSVQLHSTTDAPTDIESSSLAAASAIPATPSTTAANEPSTTSTVEMSSSTENPKVSTESAHHMEEEEAAIPMEANPAYPSLPEDDFSLRDVNFPLSETDDAAETEIKDEPRSIGAAFHTSKHTKQPEEGSGNGAAVSISDGERTSTGVSENGLSSTTEYQPRLPVKVALLMNSAEDLSAETAIANNSDFQLDRIMRLAGNKTESDESLEAQLSSESGSGGGDVDVETKKEKRREPTTPRPTPISDLDIDELSNASGDGKSDTVEDPKLDAESIKADENIEEGIIKQEVGQKEDVLTVNTNAAQERTLEEERAVTVIDSGVNGRLQQLLQQRFNKN